MTLRQQVLKRIAEAEQEITLAVQIHVPAALQRAALAHLRYLVRKARQA